MAVNANNCNFIWKLFSFGCIFASSKRKNQDKDPGRFERREPRVKDKKIKKGKRL